MRAHITYCVVHGMVGNFHKEFILHFCKSKAIYKIETAKFLVPMCINERIAFNQAIQPGLRAEAIPSMNALGAT